MLTSVAITVVRSVAISITVSMAKSVAIMSTTICMVITKEVMT